jgi:type I restriction enzyme S subunit
MSRTSSDEWPEVPFGDLVTHSAFGPRFGGDSYDPDGNIATLRTTDLDGHGCIAYDTMPLARLDDGRFEHHFLRRGDLVLTRSGTCGIAAVFDDFPLPVLPGAFLIRFRLTGEADPRFYRYLFNSPVGRTRVLSVAQGAVQQNLNITNLERLTVPRPPIADQVRIADVLSAYDDLIANNRRRIALLDKAVAHLYREWFVRLRSLVTSTLQSATVCPPGGKQEESPTSSIRRPVEHRADLIRTSTPETSTG